MKGTPVEGAVREGCPVAVRQVSGWVRRLGAVLPRVMSGRTAAVRAGHPPRRTSIISRYPPGNPVLTRPASTSAAESASRNGNRVMRMPGTGRDAVLTASAPVTWLPKPPGRSRRVRPAAGNEQRLPP
jgi:hypothetical protein